MSAHREHTTADLRSSGATPRAIVSGDRVLSCPEGYQLLRHLGSGGGGTVHLARDTRLDRPVALKFLHGAGPRDLERFQREARYTARLNHPGIVQIFETGTVDDRPYIAMQFVDGGALSTTRVEPERLVGVLREVAAALAHAHEHGLVHRDVKPGNILLDADGHPYVTDFGVARDISLGGSEPDVTLDGQIIGTPGLMAPEQARGAIHEIDARTDVYGLGATLYRLLTGRDPFVFRGLAEMLQAVIHEAPPLPRSLEPTIPRQLETIIVRCLEKRRQDRYPSMEALGNALSAFEQRGDSGGGAWFRRLVGTRPEAPAPDAASTTPDSEWLRHMEFVREIAAWDADLYRVSGSLAPTFERLDALRQRLDDLLDEHPDRAWARFLRGVTLFRRGHLRDALEDMELAIDRMPEIASAQFELGRLYLALHLSEQDAARRHIVPVGVQFALAATHRRLDQATLAFEEAQRHGSALRPWHLAYAGAAARLAHDEPEACVLACDRILADEPDLEQVWKLRGDALAATGEDPTASYLRALDVRRSYFEVLLALGSWQLRTGRTEAARETFDRAATINPELADCLVCSARADLADHAAGGAANLSHAHDLACRACVAEPLNYEAAVTLAEVELARGRAGAEHDWAQRALEALDCAAGLRGCQNRVELIRAKVRLADGLRRRALGHDARSEFAMVRDACVQHLEHDPDSGPWHALNEELQEINVT